jgi:hypothetical protein
METEVRALDLIVRQFVRELPLREPSPIQYGGPFEVVPPEACEVAFTQAVEEEEEDDDDVGGGGFADDNDVGQEVQVIQVHPCRIHQDRLP